MEDREVMVVAVEPEAIIQWVILLEAVEAVVVMERMVVMDQLDIILIRLFIEMDLEEEVEDLEMMVLMD